MSNPQERAPALVDRDAERSLLGELLRDNDSVSDAADRLGVEHFTDPDHGLIFAAITTVAGQGRPATPITLRAWFDAQGFDLPAGYLEEVAEAASALAGIDYLVDRLRDLRTRRELTGLADEVRKVGAVEDLELTPEARVAQVEGRLYEIAERAEGAGERSGVREAGVFAKDAMSRFTAAAQAPDGIVGVPTGLRDLDLKTAGLQEPQLVILAGRPSMGKSALAGAISHNVARRGAVVLVATLEMSGTDYVIRLAVTESGLDLDRVRRGIATQDEYQRYAAALRSIEEVPLYLDDTPALTLGALRARARRVQARHGLDLVIVDYLQLMSATFEKGKSFNRQEEVSTLARGLKLIAKELKVPVLALSQLSREVEKREDKRPQLADLRESGAIEQDADAVLFMYREEYYLERKGGEVPDDKRNVCEVIVAKQRSGPIGPVRVFYDAATGRFADLAEGHS